MKSRRQPTFAACAASCMLAFVANAAMAQASAPMAAQALPASAASAPASAAGIGPRLRSPAEIGNRAAAPGDLRPERPVRPQISIPFGKTPPPEPKGDARAVKRGNAATSGTIDDAAARCESQVDDQVRAACRAKLARESKGRLPN